MKQNIQVEDFKDELNQKILKKLYEEFQKSNNNINSILDNLTEEEQNRITEIMAVDYGIQDMEKAIDDIIQNYEKDKLNERKMEIIELLDSGVEDGQKRELERELNNIIIGLAKIR